jgi:hypothetical protein
MPIAAFYALPVVQLVFLWSEQVFKGTLNDFILIFYHSSKGDQDLCWYNHLCARPLGEIYAFNSVFRLEFINIVITNVFVLFAAT